MAGRFSIETVFKATDRITAPVSRIQNRVGKMTRAVERGFRSLNRGLDKFVGGLKSAGKTALKFAGVGVGAVTGAVGLLVGQFSKIEDAQAAFTPLLGSAAKAREMVEALNTTAASTPFQFENLADTVNQLLPVMEGNIQDVIKTIRMMGDVAGGNAQKLDSITRGFAKAQLTGKVSLESLNMIAEAGVPIFDELAQVMGVQVNEAFFKMISAGKIAPAQLTKAFEKMTGEGGKFFNGMEIASQTTSGLFSTLKDNIALTAAELGSTLAPVVKELIRNATAAARRVREWVKNNRELISTRVNVFVDRVKKAFAQLVDTITEFNQKYDVAKRFSEALDAVGRFTKFLSENGKTILKTIAAVVALSVVVKSLIAVLTLVNLVAAANPFTLIAIGVAALTAGIVALVNHLGGLENIMATLSIAFMAAWQPVKDFFIELWGSITSIFDKGVAKIMGSVDTVTGALAAVRDAPAALLRGTTKVITGAVELVAPDVVKAPQMQTMQQPAAAGPQVVSPQERVARQVEESRSISTAEVTIRDETNRAEVTGGRLGQGVSLVPTGV